MDLYQVLHVDVRAEPQVIEAAFQSLSNYYKLLQNPSASDNLKFTEIKNAYEVLSNSKKRRQYDEDWLNPKGDEKTAGMDKYSKYTATYPNVPPINITNDSIGPGICQNCGSVGVVKKAVIRRSIGAVVVQFTAKISGTLCRDCISQYFWKYTAAMLYVGWWSPRSFWVSIFFFFANMYNYLYSFTLPRISKDRESSLIWQVLFFGFFALIAFFIFGLPRLS